MRIGDSEAIIDLLKERYAVQMDEGLSAKQLATGHAWRRTFEEHYHQVLEWELFFHPAGATWMRASLASQMPAVLAGPVFSLMRLNSASSCTHAESHGMIQRSSPARAVPTSMHCLPS